MDQERGSAFCLVEAPSAENAIEMHKNAHKQLPAEIIGVDKKIVKAFFGKIQDPDLAELKV